jgi:hypothetical protein
MAHLGHSIRATLADLWLGGPAAPHASDLWETAWREALQTACQIVTDADQTVDAIDLHGNHAALTNGLRIIRLVDLARELGARYGVDAHVSHLNDAPAIRVSRPR